MEINKEKLLYWLQVASSSLGAIVSAYNIRMILSTKFNSDPRFFRSKQAYAIYISLLVLIVIAVFIYLNIKKQESEKTIM